MEQTFDKLLKGYIEFRKKYASCDNSIMQQLSYNGQKPEIMIVSCSDSRVDPSLILQCNPGDIFITRNVANIVPPYEKDKSYHGTSAALEFGIRYLQVKHLILLGHSQCGGIQALINKEDEIYSDFISKWVSIIKFDKQNVQGNVDFAAKLALNESYKNCFSFPWISNKVNEKKLKIHKWFFNIKFGEILSYCEEEKDYIPLLS